MCLSICACHERFGPVKVQCVSFLNIPKSLSNCSTILVHLLGTNGPLEEIGSRCLALDGVVNVAVSTNYHPSDYKPSESGFISSDKFQFSVFLNTSVAAAMLRLSKYITRVIAKVYII